MVKKEIEIIGWIFYVLAAVFTVVVMGMLIWKLTGHSPTELDIVWWALGILVTFQVLTITVLFQINGKMGELVEFKRQTVDKITNIEKKIENTKRT
ncbi:TPA: hypothetical protein HA242_04465 [Candidatus Woesearchaeota archaeon]|nr:hypothetical protein [Candidatus Woesearchaeota archaeon]HIH12951.1 hypothetical protein [Candidatus Woesearchaeota archaeon]